MQVWRLADPGVAGSRLYGILRECDAGRSEAIVVVLPPNEPDWAAVRDRLMRATRPIGG
ncbi:MAG: Sua5 family C-terminal domain-containing protein [Isosphaeraceae bacterium]